MPAVVSASTAPSHLATSPSAASTSRLEPTKEEVEAQWLFSEDDLLHTPTVLSGILKPAEERKARRRGVALIYKVAEKSQLHSHVIQTAALFFQRFFFRRMMRPPGYPSIYSGQRTYVYQDIALAALYLASKVEEGYRKLDDIVAIACDVEPGRVGVGLEEGESEEAVLRNGILTGEEVLLSTLCFDLIIDHPQKHLIVSARKLGVEIELIRCAYANIHDAFRDPMCTFYEAPVLAAGAFALACEDADVDPTTYTAADRDGGSLTWLEAFDVAEDEVEACLDSLGLVRSSLLISEPRPAAAVSTTGTPKTGAETPYHATAPPSAGHLTPSTSGPAPHPPDQTPPTLPPPPLERVALNSSSASDGRPPTRHGGPSALSGSNSIKETFSRPVAPAPPSVPLVSAPPPPNDHIPLPPPSKPEVYVPLSPVIDPEPREEEEEAPSIATQLPPVLPTALSTSTTQTYIPLSPPSFETDNVESVIKATDVVEATSGEDGETRQRRTLEQAQAQDHHHQQQQGEEEEEEEEEMEEGEL